MNTYLVLSLFLLLPAADAQVIVHNDQQYTGDDQTIHIVGEIHNGLNYTINQASVRATLYSGDQLLGTARADSELRTISPGMMAPFDIVLTDDVTKQASRYVLDLEYQIGAPKSQVIEITDSQITRDSLNNLIITGTVSNRADTTANMISVVATLYDTLSKVTSVSQVYLEPDYLRSNAVSHFSILVADKARLGSIGDYLLVAESEEYAAVPEFPIGAGLLLAGLVGALVILGRLGYRFTTVLACASHPR